MPRPNVRRPKKTDDRPSTAVSSGLESQNVDILQVMSNDQLFPGFQSPSWQPWRVFLKALFALEMTQEEFQFFQEHTGRSKIPTVPAEEAWCICGRRSGKSSVMALVGVFSACFKDYSKYLAPGEKGIVKIMSGDREQSRAIFNFVSGILHGSPFLEQLIVRETSDKFELSNRIVIEVGTASYKRVRGLTLIAALCDELAVWAGGDGSEVSLNPDVEVLTAVRPAMLTIPNRLLFCASSPISKSGELYRAYDEYWGQDSKPLVWLGKTREMNSNVEQEWIDQQVEADPQRNNAEYNCIWRTDLEDFLGLDQIKACIRQGVFERQHDPRFRYYAFCDPSGGSSDSMTLAIAHLEGATVVLDLLREYKPPFSPEFVCQDISTILKQFRLIKVVGDNYASEWVHERFRVCGIIYEPSPLVRNEIYSYLVPLINSGAAHLLDNKVLLNQLNGLRRIPSRSGGRDRIEHPRGGHDDISNCAAGAIWLAHSRPATFKRTTFRSNGGGLPPRDERPFVDNPSTNWMRW